MIEMAVNAPYARETHPIVLRIVDLLSFMLLSFTNWCLLFSFDRDTISYHILPHWRRKMLIFEKHFRLEEVTEPLHFGFNPFVNQGGG